MIRTKQVSALSANVIREFGPHARSEWRKMKAIRGWFYENTRLWVLYDGEVPLCVIGIVVRSLMGTGGEIVFLLCRGFTSRMKQLYRFLQRAMRRITKLLGCLTVRVEVEYWIGNKFVNFFGFRFCKQIENYNLYELRAAWLQ